MKCFSFYSVFCFLFTGIVVSLAGSPAASQGHEVTWEPNVISTRTDRIIYSETKFSAGVLRGRFCFTLGASVACGATKTFSVGESYTVGGAIEIEGVSINISQTYTVDESFSIDTGDCETCALTICFDNASLRRYTVDRFWPNPFGELIHTHDEYHVFTPGDLGVVLPDCRPTPDRCCRAGKLRCCPGPNPRPIEPEEGEELIRDLLEEMAREPEGDGRGAGGEPGRNGESVLLIDLRTFHRATIAEQPVPAAHPFHNPGFIDRFTPDQLVSLQYSAESLFDSELSRVVISDEDGTTHSFDLAEAPLSAQYLDDCDGDAIPDSLAIDLGLVEDVDSDGRPDSCVEPPETSAVFLRGDANGDLTIDISDPMGVFSWLFTGGAEPPCLEAADTNSSGDVDLSDGVYLLQWLFAAGNDPLAPFPNCAQAEATISCDRSTCP